MITIILVETEHAQNLGAVCRVMANFGFEKLVLINPKCSKDDIDALIRAKHDALPILKNAVIRDWKVIDEFDYLVATTARTGTHYNINRSPLTPEEIGTFLEEGNFYTDKKVNIGIVFGREGHGLFNEEIAQCDFVATIPTFHKYETMNVSHAVAIFLYELYKKKGTEKMQKRFLKATGSEKKVLYDVLEKLFDKTPFRTESKKETQRKVWKRIIGKSTLTKREAYALIGFLKKLL